MEIIWLNWIRKFIEFMLKITTALLLATLIWEVLLRIFITSPAPYQHVSKLGWMRKPNGYGYFTGEGRAVAHYNEYGFRDGAVSPRKPGELRILCLGDSYTAAEQVDVSHMFTVRLQQLLRGHSPAIPSRVFNGGRNATSPVYAVALSAQYKRIFQPDWVVLTVHDSSWTSLFDTDKEFYYQPGKTSDSTDLRVERHWQKDRQSRMAKIAARLRLTESAVWYYGRTQFSAHMTEPSSAGALEIMPDSHVSSGPAAPALDAINFTVRRLRSVYPRVVIVNIPTGSPAANGFLPASPSEEQLRASCRRYHIPFINMRSLMTATYAQTSRPPFGFNNTLPWEGHPNEDGHEIIARGLYEWLVNRLPSAKSTHNVALVQPSATNFS